MTSCWNCKQAVDGTHFCPACDKIQPLRPEEDYFAFFGYPRKLALDLGELERQFYTLSRRFHPDYFLQSTDFEQAVSLEKSSRLNDAYRTLKDPVRRAEYIIQLEGAELGKAQAPPDLLMEMFELNEQLEEWRLAKKSGATAELETLREPLRHTLDSLAERQRDLLNQLQQLFESWDAAHDKSQLAERKQDLLRQMSQLLSQYSYVRNLVRELREELE